MRHIGFVFALFGCGDSSTGPEPPGPDAPVELTTEHVVSVMDPGAIAVDATHVYFTHGSGSISRVAKAGGVIEPLVTDMRGPTSLDASTDRLCWVNTGTHAADFRDGSVRCIAKTGGVDQQLSTSYFPAGLAIDGTTIYWVEIDGQLVRQVATDGTSGATVDSSPTHKTSIAIDGSRLAWTATGAEDVVVMERATGNKSIVSAQEFSADAVTFDGNDIFWVTRHNDFETGAIRVSRDGGAPTDLVGGEYGPVGLVLSKARLLWTSKQRLRAIATSGGAAQTIVSNRGTIIGVAGDDEYLYWAESENGAIVRMRH